MRKNKYQEITAARKLLELPESATMQMIKSNYRRLLATWHPDTCKDNKERCTDMTRDIVSAYKTIMAYCDRYHYSFTKEAINTNLSPEEWWFEHFGNDAWRSEGKPSE